MTQRQATVTTVFQFVHANTEGSPDYWGMLHAEFTEDDGQWAGVCDELGTAACADTFLEAESALQEAVDLQLNGMERIADVQEYLAERHVALIDFQRASQPQRGLGFAVTRVATIR